MAARYRDRREAGRELATKLSAWAGRDDVLVIGLPRGGVPVAFEVARALRVPLDVFVVRKLGVPGHEEFAMGAIASGGVRVVQRDVVRQLGLPDAVVERVAATERRELERRERLYRDDRPFPDVRGRTVIVVDDGLATGASMQAAVAALRALEPTRIVVASPVGARETCDALAHAADECVCSRVPDPFYAVGIWYADFGQTTDDEVRALLDEAGHRAAPADV